MCGCFKGGWPRCGVRADWWGEMAQAWGPVQDVGGVGWGRAGKGWGGRVTGFRGGRGAKPVINGKGNSKSIKACRRLPQFSTLLVCGTIHADVRRTTCEQ